VGKVFIRSINGKHCCYEKTGWFALVLTCPFYARPRFFKCKGKKYILEY